MKKKAATNTPKPNNKGFTLVELIIVIAIMAVLVGLLTPQYLKFVNNSKISTDIANGQELADTFNAAFADSVIGAGTYTAVPSAMDLADFPTVKWNPTLTWTVIVDDHGVKSIKIGYEEIFPDPTQYLSHKK